MKRFFLIAAVAALIASVCTIIFNLSIIFISIVILFILALSIFINKFYKIKFLRPIIAFCIVLSLFVIYTNTFSNYNIDKVKVLHGKKATINATIKEEPINKGTYSVCVVETSSINIKNAPQNTKIRLIITDDFRATAFDQIKAKVTFNEPDKNLVKNYYSDGVYCSAVVEEYNATKVSVKPLYYQAIRFRKTIKSIFKNDLYKDYYGIPIAMISGNKDDLSEAFYSDIKATGMAHIMAVSGLHISIICGSIVTLLKKLKLGRKISSSIGMILVICLAAVAGFSGSVIRAALMYFIIFIANFFSRKSDPLNSLGFAVTIILLFNPFNIYNISFLLSSAGTLGIVLLTPKLSDRLCSKLPKNIYGNLSKVIINIVIVSFSASVFTMPISLYYFGYFCLLSPIINIFATLPTYAIMILSLLEIIFSKVMILSDIIIFLNKICIIVFKFIIETFANFRYLGFTNNDIFLYLWIVLSIVLLALFFILKKKKYFHIIISIAFVLTTAFSFVAQDYINSKTTKLTFIDSQISPCLVISRGGHAAIIGTGGSNQSINAVNFAISNNFVEDVDLIIIPSNEMNSAKYAYKLLKANNIENVVSDMDNEISKLTKNHIDINCLSMTLWNDIHIKTIKYDDTYDILIKIGNEKFLFDTSNNGYNADYILTSNPLKLYDNYKESSYIIFDKTGEAINSSHIITKSGGKTALTSGLGEIYATKYKEKSLNFYR